MSSTKTKPEWESGDGPHLVRVQEDLSSSLRAMEFHLKNIQEAEAITRKAVQLVQNHIVHARSMTPDKRPVPVSLLPVLEAFVELCAVMRVADEFYWNGAQSFGELAAKALEEQVPAASKSAAFQGHKSADHAIKATFMSKMKQAMTHARLREMFEVTGTRVSFAPGGEATIEVSEAYRQKGEEAVAAWHKFTKDVGIHTPVKLVVREGN